MRKITVVVAVAALLSMGPSSAWAQGVFPLEYEELKDSSHPLLMMSGGFYGPYPVKPPGLKGVPKDLSQKASYFIIRLGKGPLTFALEPGGEPKLYADTDADGDLSDEKPFVAVAAAQRRRGLGQAFKGLFGSSTPEEVRFGPIAVRVATEKGEAVTEVRVEARELSPGRYYLRVYPAGLRCGKVQLGDRSYQVAIADTDFNGRYDGCFSADSYPLYDWFGIDLNRNGEFDPGGLASQEVLPLPKVIRTGDGWYDLEPAPDGSSIRVAEVEPRFGTLDVGTQDIELELWSSTGPHSLKGAEAPWELPVGDYMARGVTLRHKDEQGAEWTLSSSGQTGKLRSFEVREGETAAVEAGMPLKGKVEVQQFGGTAYIGYSPVGRAGEEYSAGASRNGRQQPAPKFKIFNEAGEVLASGAFEYG